MRKTDFDADLSDYDPTVRRSITALVHAGCHRLRLLKLVHRAALMHDLNRLAAGDRVGKKVSERFLFGISPATLESLPVNLRDLGTTLRKMSQSPEGDPREYFLSALRGKPDLYPADQVQILESSLPYLPWILRIYGGFLKSHFSAFRHAFGRKVFNPATIAETALAAYVRASTGKEHYSKLAGLVKFAFHLMRGEGPAHGYRPKFSAKAFAERCRNQARRGPILDLGEESDDRNAALNFNAGS